MEAMNDTTFYPSTPLSPTPQPIGPIPKLQSFRGKIRSNRKTPIKIVIKGARASKKSRVSTTDPMHTEEPKPTRELAHTIELKQATDTTQA